jgi:ABC-type hemin transport system substrate-binding protein
MATRMQSVTVMFHIIPASSALAPHGTRMLRIARRFGIDTHALNLHSSQKQALKRSSVSIAGKDTVQVLFVCDSPDRLLVRIGILRMH